MRRTIFFRQQTQQLLLCEIFTSFLNISDVICQRPIISCQVIISHSFSSGLPKPPHVKAMFEGQDGLLAGMGPGKVAWNKTKTRKQLDQLFSLVFLVIIGLDWSLHNRSRAEQGKPSYLDGYFWLSLRIFVCTWLFYASLFEDKIFKQFRFSPPS